MRSVSALVDEGNGLLRWLAAPRDAAGHGDEQVPAELLVDGELHTVEDARISTVYDGGGRQRSAGLELWLPGEDYPRRGSGRVIAGLVARAGRPERARGGVPLAPRRPRGRSARYELMVRAEPPVAA